MGRHRAGHPENSCGFPNLRQGQQQKERLSGTEKRKAKSRKRKTGKAKTGGKVKAGLPRRSPALRGEGGKNMKTNRRRFLQSSVLGASVLGGWAAAPERGAAAERASGAASPARAASFLTGQPKMKLGT